MARKIIEADPFDPIAEFSNAMREPGTLPWDSIVDFATHPSFCGLKLYPRQITLLKLIYLETHNMSAFDLDVIEEWREAWKDPEEPNGVQEDIWERVRYLKERGYRHFPHVEALIGRRGSKGTIGGVIGTEKIAQMYSLDDWQAHYGIMPGKDGYAAVVATSLAQAKKFQFADIRSTLESCEYLQRGIVSSRETEVAIRTPADVRRMAEMRMKGMPVDHTVATLRVVALSTNSASGRGAANFANFYDEFAHMISGTGSAKSSEEVYEAYQPSLDQFGHDSLTYIPTSPFTKVGKAYSLYKEGQVLMQTYDPDTGQTRIEQKTAAELGIDRDEAKERLVELTANPEMLVVQLPSWGLYVDWEKSPSLGGPSFKRAIQSYDERMMRLEKSNPEKFRVERRSQFASVLDAYLSPRKVEQMFKPVDWRDPVVAQERGRMDISYRIHVDPSLSNANFGLTIAHTELAPEDEHGHRWPHVITDFLHVWRPEDFEDGFIDYVQVQEDIDQILSRFPSTAEFTADQWNSAGMLAALRLKHPRIRIHEHTFSNQENDRRMERFKTALNLGWIHAYRDNFFLDGEGSLLENELKFLQRKPNGKVDKQDFGPCTTKDLADTLMVVTDSLLGEHLDQWQRELLGSTSAAVGSTNIAGLRSGRDLDRLQAHQSSGSAAGQLGWSNVDRAQSVREKLRAQSLERASGRGRGAGGASRRTYR